jgi:hypothetical protein
MIMNTKTINGRDFLATVQQDDYQPLPWKEDDGHGTVSEWVHRDKAPGELILNSDGGLKRFYDFSASVKTARRDNWGSKKCTDSMTAGQRAAQAARDDYEYLRAFCSDEWSYVFIKLQSLDDDGKPTGIEASVSGTEGTRHGIRDAYEDLAAECIAEERAELATIAAAMSAHRTHVRAWLAEYRQLRALLGAERFPQLCETARRTLQRELSALNEKRERSHLLRSLNAAALETVGA